MWKLFRRKANDACNVARRADAAANYIDPMTLEDTIPVGRSTEERIAMATRCHDADPMPKVRQAGEIVTAPDGTEVQVMHNGLLVLRGGYHGEWMERLIRLCRGHHEPQEERAFHEVLKVLPPRATMIELGGFWSYYTLWFLQGRSERRAVVLEPDPAHIDVGRSNARINGLQPNFVQGSAGATSAPPQPFATENSGIQTIPRYSVPDLMAAHEIGFLDLLHCDIQGAELDTLLGCASIFSAGRVGWVFVSTHVHHISGDPLTHQRCLAVLRNAGATIVAEHDVFESFSGDGLIVARFGALPDGWPSLNLSYNRYSESLFRNPLYDLSSLSRITKSDA